MKHGLLAALVLLAFAALYTRQGALAERLDALERRPLPALPRVAAEPPPPTPDAPVERPVAPPEAAPGAPAPAAPPVSSVQREAIAKEVERQLREREPSVARITTLEEPLALMERELGLSPAQKIRVEELWKRREEGRRKLFGSGLSAAEHAKKVQELEEAFEGDLRKELDYAQLETYERLKREGRLHGGIMFSVQLRAENK